MQQPSSYPISLTPQDRQGIHLFVPLEAFWSPEALYEEHLRALDQSLYDFGVADMEIDDVPTEAAYDDDMSFIFDHNQPCVHKMEAKRQAVKYCLHHSEWHSFLLS